MIWVEIEPPTDPEVLGLLRRSEALSASFYPPESCHIAGAESLAGPDARFFVAREGGRAVGCGALLFYGGYGEIKRMFVDEGMRGRGVGRALLDRIEACARQEGTAVLRLETGVHNSAAVALYAAQGYRRRGPFGNYVPDPLSIFMEKRLTPALDPETPDDL